MTGAAPTPATTLAEFLEDYPPGSEATVPDLNEGSVGERRFAKPDLQLHCDSPVCGGVRLFRCTDAPGSFVVEKWVQCYVVYVCRNCGRSQRIYALLAHRDPSGNGGSVYKIGEYPPFGPPVPSRLISLVGPDRDLFLRGRRAENLGLGIGAFAYYRRVVENQWQRFLTEIRQVAVHLGAKPAVTSALEQAALEIQFSKAVDLVKDAIPEALLIRGQNPITLLHKALSEGIHELTEDDCLTLASSIRVILAELAERMAAAVKDEQEVRDALSRLLRRKESKPGSS